MPADPDLLFGQIAIARGFCTQAQVDECLRTQNTEEPSAPLGELLLNKGYLTESRHTRVLEIQRERLRAADPVAAKNLDTVLFGRLVVTKGLLSEAKVNECLRLQAEEGKGRSLGEVMVARKYLTPAQVKQVLSEQFKTIMECVPCGLSFTVLSTTQRKLVDCPRCNKQLIEGVASDKIRTDGDVDTKTARALKSEQETRRRNAETTPSPRRSLTCKICTQPFEGVVDSMNRATCPSCHTRFVIEDPES